ncbi:MAG: iron chaperone [Pseudomonadota bacterium]
MSGKRPVTIDEYIQAAPLEGQPHLRRLYALLKSVAPQAEEAIKWGTPFFVEPRFLFAFSAHKAHLNFTPMPTGLEPFRKELEKHKTTKGSLQVPYSKPLPEDLIRRMAEHSLRVVSEREDDAFW